MLKMIKGCNISGNSQLREEYERGEFVLMANVDADKISDVMKSFISMHKEIPIFFILELPANLNDENKIRKDDYDPTHKDIYYIDGLSGEKAIALLDKYGDILINDGLSSFGFGLHDSTAEIMSEKYNIVTLWSNNLQKYSGFFEAHNIHKTDKLFTAWNTFSDKTPGEALLYECDGKNIYSLPEELKDWGIYFAEQREND